MICTKYTEKYRNKYGKYAESAIQSAKNKRKKLKGNRLNNMQNMKNNMHKMNRICHFKKSGFEDQNGDAMAADLARHYLLVIQANAIQVST